MFESFIALIKHMAEKHPDSQWWGDNLGVDMKTGKVVSQRCQKCGEELVQSETVPSGPREGKDEP